MARRLLHYPHEVASGLEKWSTTMSHINKSLLAAGLAALLASQAVAQTSNAQPLNNNAELIRLFSGLNAALPGNPILIPSGVGTATSTAVPIGPYGGNVAIQPAGATLSQTTPGMAGMLNAQQTNNNAQLGGPYGGLNAAQPATPALGQPGTTVPATALPRNGNVMLNPLFSGLNTALPAGAVVVPTNVTGTSSSTTPLNGPYGGNMAVPPAMPTLSQTGPGAARMQNAQQTNRNAQLNGPYGGLNSARPATPATLQPGSVGAAPGTGTTTGLPLAGQPFGGAIFITPNTGANAVPGTTGLPGSTVTPAQGMGTPGAGAPVPGSATGAPGAPRR
jgi:hypothetical protein